VIKARSATSAQAQDYSNWIVYFKEKAKEERASLDPPK